jgi:CheY-like chemotaxis protein
MSAVLSATASHQALRVAIVGFSAFEHRTLESYLRLCDGANGAGYSVCSGLQGADLVVADADQAAAIFEVGRAGRVREAVFVGGSAAPLSAAAHLARPIDALQVKRALDALALQRQHGLPRNLPQNLPRVGPAPESPLRAMPHRPSGRARQQAVDAHRVHDFRASSGFSNSVLVEGEARLDEVLVVSASKAERRLLHDLLGRYGYGVALAPSAAAAVELCERRTYGFVFLGLGQDEGGSFQACRRIARRPTLVGVAPVVVALSQRNSAIDRIRATFAGCDAYLSAPLNEDDLLRLLAQHDPAFERTFEPTVPMAL